MQIGAIDRTGQSIVPIRLGLSGARHMINVEVALASEEDRKQLLEFFKHYKVKEIINNRVACYLSHNFFVIVKHADTIVGLL